MGKGTSPIAGALLPHRGESLRADRATIGLAAVAVAAAGVVVGGEVLRLIRRRRRSDEVPTPETALDTAGLATRDTVAVAIEGYEEAPRHETVLFNMLNGFVGAFALMRLSTWGQRGGWWPTSPCASAGATSTTSCPGS